MLHSSPKTWQTLHGGIQVSRAASNFSYVVKTEFSPARPHLSAASVVLAAQNFRSARKVRSMGEHRYLAWYTQRVRETPVIIFLWCLFGETVLTASVGVAIVQFSNRQLVLVGIGAGIVISLIKHLSAIDPILRILVLSVHDESLYAQRCLRAGAKGYLMKEEATEKVLLAMRRILAGQIYLSEAMQSKVFRTTGKQSANVVASPLERLNDRELEIFRLLGQGVGTRRISELLHLSISTVESHRVRIKEKLGAKCAAELLQHAVKWVETESLD
jgi:DNA-binding NarL/FixJ family response regulator